MAKVQQVAEREKLCPQNQCQQKKVDLIKNQNARQLLLQQSYTTEKWLIPPEHQVMNIVCFSISFTHFALPFAYSSLFYFNYLCPLFPFVYFMLF